jgi:preprotein translocase subunit SecG
MLYYLVVAFYIVACFLLLLVVLLQQGKGGDIASAFGGGGSQTAFGARAGATVLTKATAVLGALFMVGALIIGLMGRGSSSLMQGVPAPVPQTQPQTGTPEPAVLPEMPPQAPATGQGPEQDKQPQPEQK